MKCFASVTIANSSALHALPRSVLPSISSSSNTSAGAPANGWKPAMSHTRDLGFGHAHPSLSCSFHCEGSAAIVCRRPCATGPSGTDGASRSGRTSCVGPGEHGWPNMGVSGGPLRQRVEGSRMVMRHMRVLEGFSRLGIMVQHPDGE
jgi:hypothetical protein